MVNLHTSFGVIKIELDAERAPLTVANFLDYVRSGHYANTIFHRVIDGFMIQGGGFDTNFRQKATKQPVKNEASNGLKNNRYTIAMARTSDPNSATAQFFINLVDNAFLDYQGNSPDKIGYCVFGKVTDGMNVVDAIKAVPTGNSGPFQNVPREPVEILDIVAAGADH